MDARCEGLQENLPAYLYGDLSAEERQEVADHLQACRVCVESSRKFQGVREMLEADVVPPMPSGVDIAAQVMARGRVRRRPVPTWLPMASAALVLIGIALGFGITNLFFSRPFEVTIPDMEAMVDSAVEAMVDPAVEDPEMAMTVENIARRTNGLEERYIDLLEPRLDRESVVRVDKDYRILVDVYSGESRLLAAFFQLKLGDYYAQIAKDRDKARVEFLKVFDFVDEGKVYDLTHTRIDNLLPGEPENR